MSLKNDLMYPFGNPYKDELDDQVVRSALKNLIIVARDRLWISSGRPDDLEQHMDDLMTDDEVNNVTRSVDRVEKLLEYVKSKDELN